MKLNRWTITIVVLVLVSVALLWYTFQQSNEEQALTATEAAEKAATLYNGDVQNVITRNQHYIISIKRTNSVIEATMTKRGQVKKLETIVASTEDTSKPTPQSIKLTHAQAEAIALKQLDGTIEESQFVTTSDGGYYLIEIETPNTEATFQIHALTGSILSVQYDD